MTGAPRRAPESVLPNVLPAPLAAVAGGTDETSSLERCARRWKRAALAGYRTARAIQSGAASQLRSFTAVARLEVRTIALTRKRHGWKYSLESGPVRTSKRPVRTSRPVSRVIHVLPNGRCA